MTDATAKQQTILLAQKMLLFRKRPSNLKNQKQMVKAFDFEGVFEFFEVTSDNTPELVEFRQILSLIK